MLPPEARQRLLVVARYQFARGVVYQCEGKRAV
jgi:hypothetical protein